MTKVEQLNWARQVLKEAPTMGERDDETVKYMTKANLKLREALDEMTAKRDKARERANVHLQSMTYWRQKAEKMGREQRAIEAAREDADQQSATNAAQLAQAHEYSRQTAEENKRLAETNAAQAKELDQLRIDLARYRTRAEVAEADCTSYQDEIRRLKQRVNDLVRKLRAK